MSSQSGVLLCDLHFSTQSAAEEDDLRLKKVCSWRTVYVLSTSESITVKLVMLTSK